MLAEEYTSPQPYIRLHQEGYTFRLLAYYKAGLLKFLSYPIGYLMYFGVALFAAGWSLKLFSGLLMVMRLNNPFLNLALLILAYCVWFALIGALYAGFHVFSHHRGKDVLSGFGDFFRGFNFGDQIGLARSLEFVLLMVWGLLAGYLLTQVNYLRSVGFYLYDPMILIQALLETPAFYVISLPFLFIEIALLLVLPFICLAKLRVWHAIELSFRIVSKRWFHFFALCLPYFGLSLGLLYLLIQMNWLEDNWESYLAQSVGLGLIVSLFYCTLHAAYEDIVSQAEEIPQAEPALASGERLL